MGRPSNTGNRCSSSNRCADAVRRSRTPWPLILTLSGLSVAPMLALRIGLPPAATPVVAPATPPSAMVNAHTRSDEALTLYAAGVFATAFDCYRRAAGHEPTSPP